MSSIMNYGVIFNKKKFARLIVVTAVHKMTSFKITYFKRSAMETVLQLYNLLVENINSGIQFYGQENSKKHQHFWKIIRS